ncbi:hypothetical protein LGL55_10570 [Clostridium tagluense]|uniref:hypothetical protein n=1 Tax=Clostridium tagluense TaxID=360422 RepID=UPI001CF30448|nr:hypothetical protein [Clostridium tagluense]MCB2311617.1 hypothetical protein [Clostridium tagluense]MCB2316341.1 hypothetical protein [Clostridium tagluense]MCB2321275.1 hypothetical protein [Clostridium tagluense]MCB2326210.1 hypothetical protein [Clostridium tagluense]MCB2331011.1 hypothetical protein [Clostridium tagluense]
MKKNGDFNKNSKNEDIVIPPVEKNGKRSNSQGTDGRRQKENMSIHMREEGGVKWKMKI